MRGVGGPVVGRQRAIPRVEIVVEKEQYYIGRHHFKKPSDAELKVFADEILDIFGTLRRAMNISSSIGLDKAFCQEQLVRLAEWGRVAYQAYFGEDRPSKVLASRLDESISPTFVSELTVFPWEVLFEGTEADFEKGNPSCFWGLRYTPGRILNPANDIMDYPAEQMSPSDMLFCLHHRLLQAHKEERPAIERIVRTTSRDRFTLLGPMCKLADKAEAELQGDDLLKYLYKARHNMLHFACHCKENRRGGDMLQVSFIRDGALEDEAKVIELETYKFLLRKGQFLQQPLVFLNACQSAGGADELRRTFNLPKVFIDHGAAAVIATACPVPDRFAAAFARQFYEFFLKGKLAVGDATGQEVIKLMTIGEALRETRWYFLKKWNNPLGLAYGLYSPAHYRLMQLRH